MEKTIDSMDVYVSREMVDDGEYFVNVTMTQDEEGYVYYYFFSEQFNKTFETGAQLPIPLPELLAWVKECERADVTEMATSELLEWVEANK